MAAEFAELVIVGRKLAHREQAVNHKHHGDQRDHERDNGGIGSAKEKIALEHLGDPPHGIVADQDRRDESHVSPHKKTEEQSARALRPIQPGGPMTFSCPLIQSNPSNDIGFVTHWIAPSLCLRIEHWRRLIEFVECLRLKKFLSENCAVAYWTLVQVAILRVRRLHPS